MPIVSLLSLCAYSVLVQSLCLYCHVLQVVGWGRDERGTESAEPRKVSMPIVSHGDCILSNKEFIYYVSNRTFCAGKQDGEYHDNRNTRYRLL